MFTVVFKAYKGKLEKDIETSMPEWSSARSGILVQIFCGEDKKYLQEYSRIVKESLPDAKVIGATTDGEIAGKEVTAKRSVVSITIFEHTEVRTTFSESGDSYTDGRRLSSICDKNTKLLLILSDGTYSNGEDILYGVHSLAPEVMIGGGMAGDNSTFTQTWVLHEDRLISHGAVGASLNSDLLKVRNFYYFDWLPVDRKFKITKAVGNRVYTIDHIPAVELYRRYFGDKTAERLPKVGIEFPLMVQRGSMQVARAVLGKKEDGSLILAGNVREGEEARFGFGNSVGIIKNISNALEPVSDMVVQTFFIYSCMARKRFISYDIHPEILPYASMAPTAGFFTYGEFYHLEDRNELLNETITGIALSEPGRDVMMQGACNISAHMVLHNNLETFEALSHIVEKNSEDLDTMLKLFSQSHIVLFQWKLDEKRSVEYVSPNVIDLCGYESTVFYKREKSYFDLIHPEDKERITADIELALRKEQEEIYHEPYRIVDASGTDVWVEDRARILKNDEGDPVFLVSYINDITSKIENEMKLRLHASIFDNASEAILITDNRHKIISVNPAFTKMTGYSADEVIGKTPAILKSGYHDDTFYAIMHKSLEERGEWQGEVHNIDKYGTEYIVWLSIKGIRDTHRKIRNYIALQTDMTDIYRTRQKLTQLAHYDILTKLPNRLFFEEYVKHEIRRAKQRGRKLALLYLDLDNFKTVNDSLGHLIGDTLLQEVAQRLREAVGEPENISRQGGDEFLVLVEDIEDQRQITQKVECILSEIERPYKIGTHLLHTSFSIGIAIYPDDGNNFQDLLQYSDLAMYEAKKRGKNRFHFFDDSMLSEIRNKHEIQTQLRYALSNDELSLYYQPQVCCDKKKLRGFEALLRWKSKVLGELLPNQYIHTAEESGLIIEIGKWVLEKVCKKIVDFDFRYRISANISALQFAEDNFVEDIYRLVVKYGIPKGVLELELTESVLMSDMAGSIEKMQRLKSFGIMISIDDFGTGYSSLSYLKQFPADTLKIDRSFIKELPYDKDAAAIVDAIIQMGHIFGIRIIAEGVETSEQAKFIHEHSCDTIQGYFYGRPMPEEMLEDYIASNFPDSGCRDG
jgi:diguanylate cyclase (GGDEF)-like protein/PAS domain S-box-containing protein